MLPRMHDTAMHASHVRPRLPRAWAQSEHECSSGGRRRQGVSVVASECRLPTRQDGAEAHDRHAAQLFDALWRLGETDGSGFSTVAARCGDVWPVSCGPAVRALHSFAPFSNLLAGALSHLRRAVGAGPARPSVARA